MGHGKAIIELQRHGDAGRESILISACLKYTFFCQCDELKGQYLADALFATGRPKAYLNQLISLSTRVRTQRDRWQWAALLKNLALMGLADARTFVGERWQEDLSKEWCDLAETYITLEGARGYRQVLSATQRLWARKRNEIRDAFGLHTAANDALGEVKAAAIRAPFIKDNPRFRKVATFPEHYHALRQSRVKDPEISLEERVRAGRYIPSSLPETEVLKLALMLEEGLEGKSAARALGALTKHQFPLDLGILFQYLESEDDWVSNRALDALGANSNPAVRALAFRYCDDDYMRTEAIGVLRSNFEPGDEIWIEKQYRLDASPDDQHDQVCGILEVIEGVPKGHWTSLLRTLLDTVGCQTYRGAVVDLIRARRLLTTDDLEHLSWDAASWIRRDARKLKASRARRASLRRS